MIDWNNNSNPDIQTCILLYDDRIKNYRRMREIDVILDERPELSLEMVQCDIRNGLAHNELRAYNDHRVFLYVHEFTKMQKNYSETLSALYELKHVNPEAFINEITNIVQNIRRIESNIRTKKYKTEEEKNRWTDNLEKSKIKHKILVELM